MKYSDDDLLALVKDERGRSVGFDNDSTLQAERQRSLEYNRGVMSDMPAPDNRSGVTSTDVADAVETILPDLVEIFLGGDDVITFRPTGEEDEEAAQQETDYIRHVVFQSNEGFMTLYAALKDALIEKNGVVWFDWVEDSDEREEEFEGKNIVELAVAHEAGEISDIQQAQDETGQPSFSFTLTTTKDKSRVRIAAIAGNDFTVAADTLVLSEATYCGHRSRPRAQQLLADGVSADIVSQLPGVDKQNDQDEQSRDDVGTQQSTADSIDDLRSVEIFDHYIRLPGKNGKLCLWRVTTGNDDTVLIGKREVSNVPYAAGTPYPITHRFYGRSVYDLLGEIQRIKTSLMRMALDSGYFALNQRLEVGENGSNENTVPDIMRNEPGMPIRSKTGDAVRAISSGGLSFDAFQALEYISTVGEQRSGIVRNAQGLNPDTLHDTAQGAAMLVTAAQKRVRLIARILGETLVKQLYLGVHALIRENATAASKARLRGKWVEVDPTKWGERNDMSVEIGLGSAGRVQEVAEAMQVLDVTKQVVELQAGVDGPLIDVNNVHNAISSLYQKLGIRAPERFISDPNSPNAPKPQPKPDPELQKAQMQIQADAAANQAKMQFDAQQFQMKTQADAQQAQAQAVIDSQRMQQEFELKRYQIDQELQLKRESLAAELQLKREMAVLQAHTDTHIAAQSAKVDAVNVGGEPG